MSSEPLDRLVGIGQLRVESFDQSEFDGLVTSGITRLVDAEEQPSLSLQSRFDLLYNGAHALSLAALRWHGYRPSNRYVVFQALAHTLDIPAAQWRVLSQAHTKRNTAEYEGVVEVDEQLVAAMLRVTREIADRLLALGRKP